MHVLFTTHLTDVRFTETTYASQLQHYYMLRTQYEACSILKAQFYLSDAKDASGMELITRVHPLLTFIT